MKGLAFCACLLILAIGAHGFYIPGAYPNEFRQGDVLKVNVNSLTSFDTEMPYDYYSLPFCKPVEGVEPVADASNAGTLLQGLKIETSPYEFTVKVKQTSELVCKPDGHSEVLTENDVKNLQHKIDEHYRINMILDNLPVTTYDLLDENQEFVRPGFELGYKSNGKYYIYNHLVFNVLVYLTHGEFQDVSRDDMVGALEARKLLKVTKDSVRELLGNEDVEDDEDAFYMVVGFEVSPCSIKRVPGKPLDDIVCGVDGDTHIEPQELNEGQAIVYTYDVHWQDSKIKWASRWDAYLRMPGGRVHWFGIVNSLLVVLVMASLVAIILLRTVRRDLQMYEQLIVDSSLETKEEAGWKLVSGDAFRPPANSKGLAVKIGSGVQIMITAIATLVLATLGFLSPSSRGALLTASIILYLLLAFTAGFSAVYAWGIMERTYNGWPLVCASVSTYFPGIVLLVFTCLNLFLHQTDSTGAVPIMLFFLLVLLWFLISIPLTFIGGFAAINLPIRDHPVKTNQIPRHIPPPPIAADPWLLFFAAGILPFGTVFIELYFAMTSLWLGYFYYLFGFVLLIGCLTMVINAELALLCTYVQLCAEDYRWWWSSFHRGGSVALYVAIYAVGFLISSLSTLSGFLPILIYLCYMTILIFGFYLTMATIGVVASYVFVVAIFGSIKAD